MIQDFSGFDGLGEKKQYAVYYVGEEIAAVESGTERPRIQAECIAAKEEKERLETKAEVASILAQEVEHKCVGDENSTVEEAEIEAESMVATEEVELKSVAVEGVEAATAGFGAERSAAEAEQAELKRLSVEEVETQTAPIEAGHILAEVEQASHAEIAEVTQVATDGKAVVKTATDVQISVESSSIEPVPIITKHDQAI